MTAPNQSDYPDAPADRDRWILERRPPRNRLDPWRPYAFLVEPEPGPSGGGAPET